MIEVEVKIFINNISDLEHDLITLGFEKGELWTEKDVYFDNEARQITNADGALRIRSCENMQDHKSQAYLTYKGPKMDDVSMTRNEFETEIFSVDNGKEILNALGYTFAFQVNKNRQYYYYQDISACIDQVLGLGDFLELEILVAKEEEKTEALERLLNIICQLGYQKDDLICSSYLSMLINKQALWDKISGWIRDFSNCQKLLKEFLEEAILDEICLRFLLDKTIGVTNDNRMVEGMKLLLHYGGKKLLENDPDFRTNLMKKAQMHENQFVVIYEDWQAAEAYLDVYNLLEDKGCKL